MRNPSRVDFFQLLNRKYLINKGFRRVEDAIVVLSRISFEIACRYSVILAALSVNVQW